MIITLANVFVGLLGLYLLVGLLFAISFVWKGVGQIDPVAQEGSIGFRLIILPGVMALWPMMLRRWQKRTPPPEEKSPHRQAARPS